LTIVEKQNFKTNAKIRFRLIVLFGIINVDKMVIDKIWNFKVDLKKLFFLKISPLNSH